MDVHTDLHSTYVSIVQYTESGWRVDAIGTDEQTTTLEKSTEAKSEKMGGDFELHNED